MQATAIDALTKTEPTRTMQLRFNGNVLLLAFSPMPGILCYQLAINHAPWYFMVLYVTFFAYMGITALISLQNKRAS